MYIVLYFYHNICATGEQYSEQCQGQYADYDTSTVECHGHYKGPVTKYTLNNHVKCLEVAKAKGVNTLNRSSYANIRITPLVWVIQIASIIGSLNHISRQKQ